MVKKNGEQLKIGESRAELFGIAVLLIILVHAAPYHWENYPPFLYKICELGSIGVDVFLLLSGMGLYYSMQKCETARVFYKHRIVRIIPSYLVITGVLYGIICLIENLFLTDLFLELSTLYFWIRGENETWYVSFILLLYLIYPGIYKILIGQKWVRNISLLFGIIILIEICFFILTPKFYIKYEIALSRIPIFMIGTVLGKREFENKGYSIWSMFVCAISFVFIRILLLCFGNPQTDLYTVGVRISYIFGALAIVGCIPFIRISIPNNLFRRIFESLGAVSLEIYLVHILYGRIFRSFRIYQSYNTPIAYLIFVVLPSIIIVLLAKYFLQKVTIRRQR